MQKSLKREDLTRKIDSKGRSINHLDETKEDTQIIEALRFVSSNI